MRKFCFGVFAAAFLLAACTSTPKPTGDTFIGAFAQGDPANITTNGEEPITLRTVYAGEEVKIFCALSSGSYAVRTTSDGNVDLWTNREDIPLGVLAARSVVTHDPKATVPPCSAGQGGNVHGPEEHKGH